MTAVLDSITKNDVLSRRLESLLEQRRQTLTELVPPASGDQADRATNVDAHVQLAMLDDRIAAVELARTRAARPAEKTDSGVAAIGDVVTVDFGDGAERYLLDTVEEAADGLDVITPDSPLGRALVGASAGSSVDYRAAGRTLHVTLVAIG